jgi:hypothetical protein
MAKTPGTGVSGGGGTSRLPSSMPGSGRGSTPGVDAKTSSAGTGGSNSSTPGRGASGGGGSASVPSSLSGGQGATPGKGTTGGGGSTTSGLTTNQPLSGGVGSMPSGGGRPKGWRKVAGGLVGKGWAKGPKESEDLGGRDAESY